MNFKTLVFGSVGLLSLAAGACSPGGGASAPSGGAGGSFGGNPTQGGGGSDTFFGNGGSDTMFSSGGTTTGGGGDCGSASYKSTLIPSNILFLVDRSGSMNCNLTTDSASCESNPVTADPNAPTRWSSIVSGVGAALDQLATVPNTSVGLTFFSVDDVCGVKSTPNVELAALTQPQVDALKSALTNGSPRGGTPIIGATILGYKYLQNVVQAGGNRFVVLVTDGEDSCITSTATDGGSTHTTYADEGITGDVVDRLLNVEEPKAATVNIRTFVIGAPGSEPGRALLSAIAYAGNTAKDPNCVHDIHTNPEPGTECHFDMTRSTDFATDLAAALKKITGQAISCDYDVPTAADGKRVDPNKLNVDYYKNGGTTDADVVHFYRDDHCTSSVDGWHYTDTADGGVPTSDAKIQLCGGACDAIRADAKANVQVSLSCIGQRLR